MSQRVASSGICIGAGSLWVVLFVLTSALPTNAAQLRWTQELPSGFQMTINGASPVAFGPIKIVGTLDSSAADIDADLLRGEFPLQTVRLTGGGYVDELVTTPLGLLIYSTSKFAFQRLGEFNEGITGWAGATSGGAFISDVNDLSTLGALPYTTNGANSFWHDGLNANIWTLESGDTIGTSSLGGSTGVFSIEVIPEPASAIALTFLASLTLRRRS